MASLAGCAENQVTHTAPETPTTGTDRATVSGHVLDTTGAPVAGATVTVRTSGEHATVDSTGAFSLDVPANTTLTLSATAPSMAPTLLQQFLVSTGTTAQVGNVAGATVQLTPSLGRMMYAPAGMADPDPAMAAVVQSDDSYAWALGVQPHVSIMQFALHGVSQVEPPYAIDDVIWPGSFTVDAGALTLVTLFTK
jgi:hypothetical protein